MSKDNEEIKEEYITELRSMNRKQIKEMRKSKLDPGLSSKVCKLI